MGLADTLSSAQHSEKEVTNAGFLKKEMSIKTFSEIQTWFKYFSAGESREDAFDSVCLRDKWEYFVKNFASAISLEN